MKKKNIIISIVFLLYLGFFSLGSLLVKDRTFSDMENRSLQTFPKIKLKSIADGSFMEDFESYMQDQIICKDGLVELNTAVAYGMNQRLIQDVYFADNDRMIQDYQYDESQLGKNVDYVNDFVEAHPEFEYTWLLVPTAADIYSDELPAYAPCDSQDEALEYVTEHAAEAISLVIPKETLLEHKEEYIFYRTDHHWTQNGAYYGYVALCEGLGITPVAKESYRVNEPSTSFYGTLYSKAPLPGTKPDSIFLYENPEGSYHVEYVDEGWSQDSLYQYENLLIKDKYTTYLDGNHALLTITGNGSDPEPILVVKDSYAHSLLPFLADNYGEIHVIDLRYYHQSVSEYASEHGIKKILFINNVDFVTTDNNFLWLY
jgi:hypothetical protein